MKIYPENNAALCSLLGGLDSKIIMIINIIVNMCSYFCSQYQKYHCVLCIITTIVMTTTVNILHDITVVADIINFIVKTLCFDYI